MRGRGTGGRRGPFVPVLALGLAVASCMAIEATIVPGADVNRCGADDDCAAGGGVCDLELGGCVDPRLLDQGLVLQVVEPVTAASSEHRLVASEVNAAEPTTLRVERPGRVRGLVVDTRATDGAAPLPARLTFRRRTDLDGLTVDPLYAESSKRTFSDGRGEANNFEAQLPPGTYAVEVEPTVETPVQGAEQLYYPQRQVVEVPAGGGPVVYVDFRYPPEARRIVGVVSDAAGQPLSGVRIFARDPGSGARLSNVALTGCEGGPEDEACGRFELAVGPEVEAFRLRMEGAEADPRLPTVDRGEYRVNDPDGDGVTDVGSVRFPAIGDPVLVSAQVVGEDRAGVRSPLAGATVLFRTDAIGDPASPVGSLEARATTDEDGQTVAEGRLAPPDGGGIWLPPATYVVTVTPPPESDYASAELEVTVEAPGEGEAPLDLDLPVGPRQEVAGVVTTPSGAAVPRVRLEATAEDGSVFSAVGEDDGSFALGVDPGRYDLLVATPEASLLPWVPILAVSIFDDLARDVVAPYGAPVRGRIVRELDPDSGETEAALEGATVHAFVEVETAEGGSRLVRVGRATTAEDGSFTILVPRVEPLLAR